MSPSGRTRCACAEEGPVETLVSALAEQLGLDAPGMVFYFASSRQDFSALAREMGRRWPRSTTLGCTTAGEIAGGRLRQGSVVALGLDASSRVAASLVPRLDRFRYEDGIELIHSLTRRLGLAAGALDPRRHVLVALTDGLSELEEQLVATLGLSCPEIPLVGGSAGDDFRFQETFVALDGSVATGAGVVALLEVGGPFQPFYLDHYQATNQRFEVTSADPRRRLILTLGGRPAGQVYADLLGRPLQELNGRPTAEFADIQFGVSLGRQDYVRSVFTLQEDALLMGGAVQEGETLTVMKAGDLIGETRRGLARAMAALDGVPETLLLFSCGGRLLEARARGLLDELGRATSPVPACGFTTYGEQFNGLHMNHTLTGLVLGSRPDGEVEET